MRMNLRAAQSLPAGGGSGVVMLKVRLEGQVNERHD